ncbi:ATP-binding protein [Shimazuella kribbensis]|uniref:ATP-binding protein n=1 Tax=Shimazuella kribbensis TaxID=139808 RepID=UPI0003FF0ECA|nr:ATP-binding protein [Shimazuella kribbensis]
MLPIPTQIEKNVAFIEGRPWAFYRVIPFSYSPLSIDGKKNEWMQATQFFRQIQEPGLHAQMWMIRRRFNWVDYLDRLVNTVDAGRRDKAYESMNTWLNLIERGTLPDYDFIVAFELPLPMPHNYKWITQTFGIPMRTLEGFLGLRKKVFKEEKEHAFDKSFDYAWSKRAFEDRAGSLSRLDPLLEHEIADFYRHHFYRGMPLKPLPQTLRNVWPKGSHDYTWLAEGRRAYSYRYVLCDQEHESRFVSFITLGAFPDEIYSPGSELFHQLSSEFDFPVEGMFRWKMIANKQATSQVSRKRKDIKDATSHIGQVDQVPLDLQQQESMAEGLEFELKKNRPPILDSRVMFVVDGDDQDEVNSRSEQVINFFDRKGFVAARPTGEQRNLFEAWLPNDRYPARGYVKKMLPEVAASIVMPGASEILGDPNGVPVGLTRRGSVVKINPERGPQINQNASMVITGTLGSGKSHTLNNLIHKTALFWGARVFVVDPKGERSHWVGRLPGLEDRVHVLKLDGRQNPGALDPFQLLGHDAEFASEIAVSVISQFEGNLSRGDKNMLLSAAERALKHDQPSMAKMVEELHKDEDGRDLAEYLMRIARLPLGKLVFGEGDGVRVPDSGIILLQLEGLELPPEKQRPNGLRQEASVAVMSMTAILAEQFVLRGTGGGFRVAALDEAWIWLRTDQGKSLANRLERAGRSANAGIWFATQNPSDIDNEILNNVSVYVCLGTSDENETTLAIEALNLDVNDEGLRNVLQQRRSKALSGYGYMKDLEGRSGFIQFITPEKDLVELFNTKPEASEASKVVSEGGI